MTHSSPENADLLPCPFCGGKPFLHGPDNPGHEYWVSCQSCQASSLMRSNFDATKAAWNARPVIRAQSTQDKFEAHDPFLKIYDEHAAHAQQMPTTPPYIGPDERTMSWQKGLALHSDTPAQCVPEALRAIYEWYDRDGSVGGASEVFEAHRSALTSPESDVRGQAHRDAISPSGGLTSVEAAAIQPQQTWKPIETAPKDGTPMLLCVWEGEADVLPVTSGFWSQLSEIWFSEITGKKCKPTHWMPLPGLASLTRPECGSGS